MPTPHSHKRYWPLTLALVTASAFAGPVDYYCDETASNDPPTPCWLTGVLKGRCPTLHDTIQWDCVATGGWIPAPPTFGPGDGGPTHLNGVAAMQPAAAHRALALDDAGSGRGLLITADTADLARSDASPILTLIHPLPAETRSSLWLHRDSGDQVQLVIERQSPGVDEGTVLATVPLDLPVDHVQVSWRQDAVGGPVLLLGTRNTRLTIPLPELSLATVLEVAHRPSTAIVELPASGRTPATDDR